MILAFIIVLACLSYYIGITSVIRGHYRPSIYSRLIWMLLGINSFWGVVQLHNSTGTIALAGIQLLGCVGMLLAAWKYSNKSFGTIEKMCTLLLIISALVWLVFDAPFINVAISLIAHFIGAIPSIFQVAKNPQSENFIFWFCFALASILAFTNADTSTLHGFIYALYFALFDSGMSLLTLGKYFKGPLKI